LRLMMREIKELCRHWSDRLFILNRVNDQAL
jgi:hypothetical protein